MIRLVGGLLGLALTAYAIAVLVMLRRGLPREPPYWYHPRRILKLNAALLDQLTLVTCAPLAWPLRAFRSSSNAQLGIPFGSHGLKLDAFRPLQGPVRGVIVFLYGGAWGSGDRKLYGLLARTFVLRGQAVVVPDYRLHPHTDVDGMLADVREALSWSRSYAASLGTATDGLCLLGHSAGAHLAALLLVRSSLGGDQEVLAAVRRFVGLSGVYDIADHYRHEHQRGLESISPMGRVMGGSGKSFAAASPTLEVAKVKSASALPVMALVHGSSDKTVPSSSSLRFGEALAQVGWPHSEQLLADAGHLDPLLDLMRTGHDSSRLLELCL